MKKLSTVIIISLLCISTLAIFSPKASALNSLVGYWKFDESSGNTAYDSSGNVNSGTVNGAGWTSGISNGALQFDGVNDYVGIADSSSLRLTSNQASLELWFKPTVTLDSTLTHRINILDKGNNYGFQMEAGARIFFTVWIGGNQWLGTVTSSWIAGTWYHIAGTYDGITEKVYVNGILENSQSISGSLSGSSYPLSIGSYCLGTMNFFNGAIDEVQLFDYARTSQQILDDYNYIGPRTTLTVNVFDESGFPPASIHGANRIANMPIKIYTIDDTLVTSGSTDASGTASFNLANGQYKIVYGSKIAENFGMASKIVDISGGSMSLDLYAFQVQYHTYYGGGPYELNYIDLDKNSAGYQDAITVQPGQQVSSEFSWWELETVNVPIWYVSAFGSWNPTSALGNLASGCASPHSHNLYTIPLTFTAPSTPGTYEIRLIGVLDYRWPNSYYTAYHYEPAFGRDMGMSIIGKTIDGPYGKGRIIVEEPEGRAFSPLVDGFCFDNVPQSFVPTWCEEDTNAFLENLVVSIEAQYPDLYDNCPPLRNQKLRDAFFSMISTAVASLHGMGHCYGMTKTSKQYFLQEEQLPIGVASTYDLCRPSDGAPYASSLQKLIDDNQNSLADPYILFKFFNLWLDKTTQEDEYNAVRAVVSTGTPAIISMHPTSGVKFVPHTVLAYGVDDSNKRICIYDPNAHGKVIWLRFEEVHGSLVMRDYITDYGLVFDRMAFTETPSDILNAYEYILTSLNKLLGFFVRCPVKLSIFDSEGKITGLNETGNIFAEIPNSICIARSSEEGPQTVIIFEPTSTVYSVVLVGSRNGNYTLTIGYIASTLVVSETYNGTISEQETQVFSVVISQTELIFQMDADVNIDPATLNLASKGRWVTAYIELSESINVNNINVSSILLNSTIPVDLIAPVTIGDYDNDGIPDLMVKFERAALESWIYNTQRINYGTVALTISGTLNDGTLFKGIDTIFVNYAGDVNNDGAIDIFDILSIKYHRSGPPSGAGGYDINADLDKNGFIDVFDMLIAKDNLGQTTP